MNLRRELEKIDLFSQLSPHALDSLSQGCVFRRTEAERFIFHEGDEGSDFFLMLSGRARVYKSGADGKEIPIKLISRGDVFGEVVLFEDTSYPASCVCVEDCEFIQIRKRVFTDLLKDASFSVEFFSLLMKKLRYLNERIIYLSAMDVDERFFRFLRDNYGVRPSYDIAMSKKDAALAIGTIPETFSRMIARLKKSGLIEWDSGDLKVAARVWDLYD